MDKSGDVNYTEYKKSPRWPATYACDLVREIPDKLDVPRLGKIEVKLSRSEASQLIRLFAEVTGISRERLYVMLAKEYCKRYDP